MTPRFLSSAQLTPWIAQVGVDGNVCGVGGGDGDGGDGGDDGDGGDGGGDDNAW